MNINIYVSLIVLLTVTAQSGDKEEVFSNTAGELDRIASMRSINPDSLKNAYSELIKAKDRYINQFPSTYLEFISLFGLDEEDPTNLYNSSYEYIESFFDGDKNLVMEKSILLAVDMVWDVDAVSHFQHEFIDFIILNSKEFPYHYSKLKSDEKRKIVRFMLAGYYKNNELLSRLGGFKFILPDFYKLVQHELENWQDEE